MLENSKKLMDFARDAGCTIVHCPIGFEKVCSHHALGFVASCALLPLSCSIRKSSFSFSLKWFQNFFCLQGHHEISSTPYGILAGVKDGEAFTNGEWGSEFCETMKPKEGDKIVKGKSGLCGFYSTNLDFLLRYV